MDNTQNPKQQAVPTTPVTPDPTINQPAQQPATVTINKEHGPITIAANEQGRTSDFLKESGPNASPEIAKVVEEIGVKETVPHQPQIHPTAQVVVTPGPDAVTLDSLTGDITTDFKVLLEEPDAVFKATYKKEKNTSSPTFWILHVAKKLRDRFKRQKLETLAV